MKRGEIYYVQLDPAVGSEIKKTRPVVIVSNNIANRSASHLLTVVPLTSNVQKIYPFEVALTAHETGLGKDSKAVAQQIRSVDRRRLISNRLGVVTEQKMQILDAAMRLHLSL